MKKIFKNLVLVLMLVMSSLTFAKGKLYVGTNAEFPPFEYLENSHLEGVLTLSKDTKNPDYSAYPLKVAPQQSFLCFSEQANI